MGTLQLKISLHGQGLKRSISECKYPHSWRMRGVPEWIFVWFRLVQWNRVFHLEWKTVILAKRWLSKWRREKCT